jgi:uncharacterized protein YggT (Ycf19 family)
MNVPTKKYSADDEVIVPTGLKFSKIIVWIMYIWVLIGVISLSFRVFLLATSANTATGFGNFVMNVSSDYLEPFRGIFTGNEVGQTGYLDVSAIFAIIVYLLVLWGFKSLIQYVQNKIDLNTYDQTQKIAEARRQQLVDIMEAKRRQETLSTNAKQAKSKTAA